MINQPARMTKVRQKLKIPLCLNGWMTTWGASEPNRNFDRGDKVAVLSPSFAVTGFAPVVHEQATARLVSVTGLLQFSELHAEPEVGLCIDMRGSAS